ncbi:MAG: glucosaminidase domain-containing protein [Proteobacteria bacterium]|nr:glucosaminidase domain-containing protein [Pseudomonadota bacterium]
MTNPTKALLIIPITLVLLGILLWTAQPTLDSEPTQAPPVPDFAAIKDVKTRKETFFRFMLPKVRAANDRVLAQRAALEEIAAKMARGSIPDDDEAAFLQELTVTYRLKQDPAGSPAAMQELLKRVDIIPASLVLAQSANESALGTARFARHGRNFFGLWCWSENCGLVPDQRPEDARHEVASFQTIQDNVDYYVLTINSHPAYQTLREIRYQHRQQGKPLTGAALSTGLLNYSERREAYVDEIRAMIRINKLSRFNRA